MTLTFYQYGADKLVATLELDEAHSSIIERINEPTRLSATLTSDTAPTLQLGARTTYKGVTYYVTKEPTVRKEHSKLYVIETELETVIGLARLVILDNPVDKRSIFDYTATATEHVQLVVDSFNGKKLSKIPAWTRGKIRVPDKVKHIKYDGISAWDAIQLIRQTYETDLHIDGTAIALGISSDKANAIELAYGKGNGILSGLERLKHDDTPTPMRLYVTGTKRNMTQGRLTMQPLERLKVNDLGIIQHGVSDTTGQVYTTDSTGQYITEYAHEAGAPLLYTEATYTNEEIYPSHVSTIKTVTKVKDHFEVNSDFDYTSLRIEGEQMQVVFQTGNLAGRDFDARHYSSTGRLAIVPKEEDDTTLPNDTLCPKVGDQYIVTGIKLPDQYITEAQRKLTEAALRHLIKLQLQRYSYKAEIDPVYLHNNKTTIGTKLDVGKYVHLTDQQIAVGDPYIRIIAKRTYLDRPYTPEIELSNEVERLSIFERLIRDTDGMRIDTEEMRDRLRNNGMALDSLAVTSGDISERLKTAEEALTGKQPVGSYVDPSQLATSQQQTLAEAVKQAEEMDKQIKVGGRNLIVTSRWKAGYLYGDRDENAYPVGSENYKVYVGYDKFRFDPVYIPTLGEREVTYKLYDNGGVTNGTVQIHAYDKDKKFLWWSCDGWDGAIGHTNAWTLPADTAYIRLGVTNENVRAKVEFGTVVTDWTPAPEDVAESVSKVSKSLMELSDHPLTVDKDGYWQIWSVKDSKYVTTQYQSRGEAGRYLGRAKRIHPDFNGNYLLEPEGSSWRTAKEGDYVYLVGDAPNRGGDKDTYYIVREHKSKTVWEVYNIKGRVPVLTLDSQHHLLADGKMVSMQSLKGEAGHSPAPEDVLKTERFKQLLGGEVTTQVTTQITPLEGDLDETRRIADEAHLGSRQALEGLENTKKGEIAELLVRTDGLGQDLDAAKTDIGTAISRADAAESAATDVRDKVRVFDGKLTRTNNKLTATNNKVTELKTKTDTATTNIADLKTKTDTATANIADLSNRSLTRQQKEDLVDITDSLQVLRSGSNNTLEGLALQRIIALSGDGANVSAYIASNPMDTAFKAGIVDFGKPTEREQVEITHQGTGHIGNLYFAGNQIDFRTGRDDDPYLSIGAEESQFIGQFISTARLDDTPVSVSSLTLTTSTTSYERTADVANDGTRLTVTIDSIKIETYGGAKTRLTLDGEVLAEWRGKEYKSHGGSLTGGDIEITLEPYTASNLSYERVVKAGSHTIRLDITNPTDGATATVRGLRVRRRYDTGRQQSVLTKSGLRLFGSPDRYLDVDYRKEYYNGPNNDGYMVGWIDNDYTVRIKGGAKVDKLTADELDVPGVPLCGATFNEYGTKINSFGERAKQQGTSVAQAYRAYNTDFYRVYHSIGHKNYIPVLQVYGLSNGNYTQCLTTRIDAIEADSFAVRIVTTGNVSVKHSFSYVAFKTTE